MHFGLRQSVEANTIHRLTFQNRFDLVFATIDERTLWVPKKPGHQKQKTNEESKLTQQFLS